MVIVSGPLPGTDGHVLARLQEFLFDCIQGEILIALYNHGGIALRDDFTAPGCLSHSRFSATNANRCIRILSNRPNCPRSLWIHFLKSKGGSARFVTIRHAAEERQWLNRALKIIPS